MSRTETLSRAVIVANKYTRIVKETFRHLSGEGEYLIVERKPALMIIPITCDGGTWYTYMVRQYRYPIKREVWQFPMGTLESDSPKKHALLELKEETGIRADKMICVGSYFVDPGLSRQRCIVFIAQKLTPGYQQLEETEMGMVVKKFQVSDLSLMVKRGEIQDGWGFSGLYYLNTYLNNLTK